MKYIQISNTKEETNEIREVMKCISSEESIIIFTIIDDNLPI